MSQAETDKIHEYGQPKRSVWEDREPSHLDQVNAEDNNTTRIKKSGKGQGTFTEVSSTDNPEQSKE